MSTKAVEDVIDRIAEIIRRVGKRDEVEDEVAENINLSDLANELIKEDGPVRDTAIKVVCGFLKGTEIDPDSEAGIAITEGVDFKAVAESVRTEPEIQSAIKELIRGVIDNLESSDDIDETVKDAFGLNSADKLEKILGREAKSELNQVVAQKIKEFIEGSSADDLQEGAEVIEKVVFTPDRVAASLAEAGEKVNETIGQFVLEMVSEANWRDHDSTLCREILSNKALQTAIDSAVDQLVRTGKINQLVEDAAISIFDNKNSSFRSRIEEAVSSQIVGRIAESVVSRMFDSRR